MAIPAPLNELCCPTSALQPLPEAGATEERTLLAVGCKALLNEALRAVFYPPYGQTSPEGFALSVSHLLHTR